MTGFGNSWQPTILGYRVPEPIGRGGTSVVFHAIQEKLERHVAVKVLLVDDPEDPLTKRFARELHAIGRLGEPSLAPC